MIIDILIVLAVIVIGLIVFIASRPSDFIITRSATIPAPASVLFDQVNDLHLWNAWSPWARMDPNSEKTYEGVKSGVGAIFRWKGNKEVGQGSMTILESVPDKLVRIRLDFLVPFKATNFAKFTFEPKGDQTLVTWSMTGNNSFIAKAVVMVMNCDKMIGGIFEKGLVNLQEVTAQMTVNS